MPYKLRVASWGGRLYRYPGLLTSDAGIEWYFYPALKPGKTRSPENHEPQPNNLVIN
jgi:hypothetical protein